MEETHLLSETSLLTCPFENNAISREEWHLSCPIMCRNDLVLTAVVLLVVDVLSVFE